MKILKWIGIVLGSLIGLLVIVVLVLFFIGRGNLTAAPEVAFSPISANDTDEGRARGEHLSSISSCNGCHGTNLEGTAFIDEAPIGYVPAPNLTTGAGGVGSDYTDADWEKAIRHGVAADGRTISAMPSDHYAQYGDDDLADLIAYLKTAPAVDSDLGPREMLFPGNIIFGVLAFPTMPVNLIDHESVGGNAPAMGETAEYGEYFVSIASCASCHAENLAGNYGQLESPLGQNLTNLQNDWTAEEFATTLRTGSTPDGRQLNEEMPWSRYSLMSDEEVNALWAYLNTLEPLPNNQ